MNTTCKILADWPLAPVRKLSTQEIGRADPEQLAASERHPVSIVVENVRSAFNVGAMLRTGDALRVQHVYLAGYSPGGDHRGVHKAALGAQDTVPWTSVPDAVELLATLRDAGYTLAAVEITDTPTLPGDLGLDRYPLVLVVGNEVHGVSPEALSLCDIAIEIPQYGAKHSLNVSVALGIVGYDVVRRWHKLNHPSE